MIQNCVARGTGVLKINGEKVDPKRQYVLQGGDTVAMATPGGGGYGDAAARDSTLVRSDVAAGYVTGDSSGRR